MSAKHAQRRSDDLNGHPQALGYLACAPKIPVYLVPHMINGPHNGLVVHFRPSQWESIPTPSLSRRRGASKLTRAATSADRTFPLHERPL
jgi:hypothetical protein